MKHISLAAAAGALLVACASTQRTTPATTPATPPVVARGTPAGPVAGAEESANLPAGAGRTILQTHCTWCHDLREVTKFNGFYDRRQWRDVVVTMVEYGAAVKGNDVDVLAGYLDEHFGRK